MYHLSSEEIKEIDRIASEIFNIPSILLMENAGRSAAEVILRMLKISDEEFDSFRTSGYPVRSAAIFIGGGKNGGDGLVVARFLANNGVKVNVYLMKDEHEMVNETRMNYQIVKSMKLNIKKIDKTLLEKLSDELGNVDAIIDALLGIGLKGDVSNEYSAVIDVINGFKNKIKIFAIDVPSGLDCDKGIPCGNCVMADYTITIGFLKRGFLNDESARYTGEVIWVDAGYPYSEIKGFLSHR